MNSHQEFLRDQTDKEFHEYLQEECFGKEYADEWDYAINLNRKEIKEHIADPKKTIVITAKIDRYRWRCRVKELVN